VKSACLIIALTVATVAAVALLSELRAVNARLEIIITHQLTKGN
jgi:hypothetical protein